MLSSVLLFQSLDVKWESPPAKHVNGLLTQYVIQYKQDGASGGFITHRIPASKQQYRITGLTKGATYAVQVAAATEAGDGPFCLEVKGKVQSTSSKCCTNYSMQGWLL